MNEFPYIMRLSQNFRILHATFCLFVGSTKSAYQKFAFLIRKAYFHVSTSLFFFGCFCLVAAIKQLNHIHFAHKIILIVWFIYIYSVRRNGRVCARSCFRLFSPPFCVCCVSKPFPFVFTLLYTHNVQFIQKKTVFRVFFRWLVITKFMNFFFLSSDHQ